METVKETKALSTLSNIDTSVSAAPMNMSKPNKTRVENLLLTPPDEKRSTGVSFGLSNSITLKILKMDSYSNGSAASPAESIDISVRDLSEEISCALVERDTEMKYLFDHNKDFFDMVKQSIFEDDERWKEFLKVLYSKREKKSDSEWMNSISEFLSDNPPFLVNFKQIIGYYENDDDVIQEEEEGYDDDDYYYNNSDSCVLYDTGYSGYFDITPIRNLPEVLKNFEKTYPQFFINAKKELGKEKLRRGSVGSTLGGNHLSNDNPLLHPNVENQTPEESSSSKSLYDELKRILITPRSDMDDNEWETAIYELLEPWPLLVKQLEELIEYEIKGICIERQ